MLHCRAVYLGTRSTYNYQEEYAEALLLACLLATDLLCFALLFFTGATHSVDVAVMKEAPIMRDTTGKAAMEGTMATAAAMAATLTRWGSCF